MKVIYRYLISVIFFGFLLVYADYGQGNFSYYNSPYTWKWKIERFSTVEALLERLNDCDPDFIVGVWNEQNLQKIEIERKTETKIWYQRENDKK